MQIHILKNKFTRLYQTFILGVYMQIVQQLLTDSLYTLKMSQHTNTRKTNFLKEKKKDTFTTRKAYKTL